MRCSTPTVLCPSNSKVTVRQHGPSTVTITSSVPTTVSFASAGTSEVTVDTLVLTKTSTSMSALSVVVKPIMPSHGPAACNPQTDMFVKASLSPHLSYSDFSSSIITQLPLSDTSPKESLLFNRILHPYNADTFESLLCKHNLSTVIPFSLPTCTLASLFATCPFFP